MLIIFLNHIIYALEYFQSFQSIKRSIPFQSCSIEKDSLLFATFLLFVYSIIWTIIIKIINNKYFFLKIILECFINSHGLSIFKLNIYDDLVMLTLNQFEILKYQVLCHPLFYYQYKVSQLDV